MCGSGWSVVTVLTSFESCIHRDIVKHRKLFQSDQYFVLGPVSLFLLQSSDDVRPQLSLNYRSDIKQCIILTYGKIDGAADFKTNSIYSALF